MHSFSLHIFEHISCNEVFNFYKNLYKKVFSYIIYKQTNWVLKFMLFIICCLHSRVVRMRKIIWINHVDKDFIKKKLIVKHL